MNVFAKVETIGDSYVAVSGLPTPRENHVVVMAQFAQMCLRRMTKITRDLEVYLGPSTGDLRARIGLHRYVIHCAIVMPWAPRMLELTKLCISLKKKKSGPVTAGVLRGEKARFQLFGNTVNTASRLEASGLPNRIHCSRETKELLVSKGKESWIISRDQHVHLKGVGALETFWVTPRVRREGSVRSCQTATEASQHGVDEPDEFDDEKRIRVKHKRDLRLIDWNVQVLYSLLEEVAQHRVALDKPVAGRNLALTREEHKLANDRTGTVINEMTQILEMPEFDARIVKNADKAKVAIKPVVRQQLEHFVSTICGTYRDVPFHNFEHGKFEICWIDPV